MEKVHVICIPFPVQSHITSMMKLAKILHSTGCHITFVNSEFNHQRLLNSRGPDSLKEPFRNLIYKLNSAKHPNVLPVSCIVSDIPMCFTLQTAKEFGIPGILYFPISFSAYACFLHLPHLMQRGLIPPKGMQNRYYSCRRIDDLHLYTPSLVY
ncbi:hypothetical protein MKW94_016952 [Papaver nudicaule]|uniref:Uncharacterized protein n=1 Tax=Papaver nudicaule TaxID=74823 RepID=A0AA41SCY9_PAPNU|nr:hypothetical protein [Papaver nudicaule]